jgi:hypothetical protein
MALFSTASSALVSTRIGAGPLAAFAGIMEQAGRTERYLPFELVKGQLAQSVEQSLASDLVSNTVASFEKGLQAQRSKPEEYVKTEVGKYAWKHGASAHPDDRYNLANDPGLAGLKDAHVLNTPTDPKAKELAGRFFSDSSLQQGKKLYNPQMLRAGNKTVLYWKTSDEPAVVLPFEKARPQVVQAWRLQKARELAKAEADKIAATANKPGGDPVPELTEAAKRLKQNVMELHGVARLVRTPSFRAGAMAQYAPYRVPEDKIEYAASDFTDQVLELKQPGDVKVVSDEPEKTYYVVALMQKVEPTVREFQRETAAIPPFQPISYFLARLQMDREVEYRRAALNQLKADARVKIFEDKRQLVDERDRSSQLED